MARTRTSTPAKPTSRSPASPTASSKEPPTAPEPRVALFADQVHRDDGVVGPQAQVTQLCAQAVDLTRHQVEPGTKGLGLGVAVGILEAPQEAPALGPRRLQAVSGGHEVARDVLSALALRAHRAQAGQRAQRALQAARGDAQLVRARRAAVPGVELRAQDEAAVAGRDATHPVGQRGDLVVRRGEGHRDGTLDPALALLGGKAGFLERRCGQGTLAAAAGVCGARLGRRFALDRAATGTASAALIVGPAARRRSAGGEHEHDHEAQGRQHTRHRQQVHSPKPKARRARAGPVAETRPPPAALGPARSRCQARECRPSAPARAPAAGELRDHRAMPSRR